MIPLQNFSPGSELTREFLDNLVRAIQELQGHCIENVHWPLQRTGNTLSALAAAANPYAVFPVILHQTGGSSHYPADWTYTIKDVTDATTLATSVNPTASPHLYRRSSCYLGPATHGLAHMVGSALVLDWIDEIEGEEACITP